MSRSVYHDSDMLYYLCDSPGNTLPAPITEEVSDNKEVEHVNKYTCLGSSANTIRKPSEQQHEEKGRDEQAQSEESDAQGIWKVVLKPWVPPRYPKDICVKQSCVPERSSWISSWFDSTIEDYDETIRKHVSEVPNKIIGRKFAIHAGGYCIKDRNPGYGAIICDNRCKPIIAESKVLPEGERVSPFYHELQGVNLGLKLAIHYRLLNFRFYCTSYDVVVFLEDCLRLKKRCSPFHIVGLCDVCLKSMLPVDQKENEACILPIIQDIITQGSKLESLGLHNLFSFTDAWSQKNKVADWLAKLGVSKKMKPHEIQENVELTDLLYNEAVDLYRSRSYAS